jgi:hypothetical protein
LIGSTLRSRASTQQTINIAVSTRVPDRTARDMALLSY